MDVVLRLHIDSLHYCHSFTVERCGVFSTSMTLLVMLYKGSHLLDSA